MLAEDQRWHQDSRTCEVGSTMLELTIKLIWAVIVPQSS